MSTQRLGRRSWLWADGARLAGPAVVLVGLVTAVAVTTSDQDQAIAMAAVVGAGILGHFVLRARFGYRAVHKRVARARAQWADAQQAQQWTYRGDDLGTHPTTVDLALPRGWRPPIAMASMQGHWAGRQALVQTWVLRSVAGSRRLPTRKEIVVVHARTGPLRCAVSNMVTIDAQLIDPAWTHRAGDSSTVIGRGEVRGDPAAVAAWGEAIHEVVAQSKDLPLTVTAGGGQVIVYAMDDARVETTQARLDLATTVAGIVESAPASD
ncbi:MAG TPA: hypothetical protein VK095_02280 [Beutenbergiaceae bacterium]|nr:hypothetical protein [Beutenbergiaceae bacterium]